MALKKRIDSQKWARLGKHKTVEQQVILKDVLETTAKIWGMLPFHAFLGYT